MEREKLTEIGVDIDIALERFCGNEALYIKFLKKFPTDSSYEKLVVEINRGRAEEAFKLAHTLKGLAGNLSLMNLYHVSEVLVEKLRAVNLQEAQELMKKVSEEYKKAINAIEFQTDYQ